MTDNALIGVIAGAAFVMMLTLISINGNLWQINENLHRIDLTLIKK